MTAEAPPRPHEDFNFPDGDVTFQSCDNVLFKLHRKRLGERTGGFPGEDIETQGEIIHLEEPGTVLEILFQYVYPEQPPRTPLFNTFMEVAEAVQKYDVFFAEPSCKERLIKSIPEHPVRVMLYAIKQNQPELIDKSALHMCRYPIIDVINQLPHEYVVPWVRYHEDCCNALFSSASYHVTRINTIQHVECAGAAAH